jgi:hypothetical protein
MLFHALTLVAMTGLVGRPTALADGRWTDSEGASDAGDWDAGEQRRCVADHRPRRDTSTCVRWGKRADGCGTAALGLSG